MRRSIVPLSALLLILSVIAFLPAPAAAARPAYFETVAVSDTANDFGGHAALDIVAVHFGEKHQFSKDTLTGEDVLVIRFELRDIGAHTCGSTSRYEIGFKSGGQDRLLFGSITSTPSTGSDSCKLTAVQGTGVTKLNDTSLTITVTTAGIGLVANGTITSICAKSAIVQQQVVYQDVVPLDNANAPMSACPSTLPSYTAKGVFPFVTVASTNGLFQYSINGAEVEYEFNVYSHPALSGDQISAYFDIPEGWSVAPSQGTTGATPIGSFTGGSNGAARLFSFSLSNNAGASIGDTAQVVMQIISDSGGRANVTALVEVSGEKIEDPYLTVKLATPGPFKAGATSEVRFQFAYDNSSVSGESVKVDLLQGTRRLGTFPATEKTNGTYAALVQFPGAGTYTLDAYLASQTPSPHQSFVVNVEKSGGLLPGPGAPLAFLVLAVLALRRRH